MLNLLFALQAFASWQLNDVAVLVPLPALHEESLLLSGPSAGAQGPLLDRATFDKLPHLVEDVSRQDLFDRLHVVAMRFEPCARDAGGPCRRMIRFVWQPFQAAGGWTTRDAAVHSFHLLSEAEWAVFLEKWRVLKERYPLPANSPLDVHPVLKAQGLRGPLWTGLRALLLETCGKRNLTRVTTMDVTARGDVWRFRGIDLGATDSADAPMQIPGLRGATFQAVFSSLEAVNRFEMHVAPLPEHTELHELLDDSREADSWAPEKTQTAVRLALRNLNPRLIATDQVDCISCHISRQVPAWAAPRFGSGWETMFGDVLFRGPGNLENRSVQPERGFVLRAFGYFGRDPLLSPRVIQDASLSVEQLGN